jgi:signal transduction histidine kinase
MIKRPGRPYTLFSKLMLSHLAVVALSLLIVGFFLTYLIEKYFFSAREWEVAGQARDVAYLVADDLGRGDLTAVEKTIETIAFSLDAKIRVLDDYGAPFLTIDPETELAENKIDQQEGVGLEEREIEHVFKGNMLTKKVYGPVLQRLLVAAPVYYEHSEMETEMVIAEEEPQIIGAITLSVPLLGIEENLAQISRLILYAGTISVLVAAVFVYFVTKNLTRPLYKINQAALKLAEGNYDCKIEEKSNDEIGTLIKTFNYSVEQVEKNVEEQKKLEQLRRNLVANVSHELKAPLASIRGFSELMLDGLVEESDKEKYMQVILDNSVHLSRLVDDLLTLSHLESGQLYLEKEEISIDALARWSFDSIATRGEEKDLKMNLELAPSLPVIKGDRTRLHEILINLLENAVEHTPPGGEVTLKVYCLDYQLVIEVRDTGCGISEEDLPYIFERFYKTDRSRAQNSGSSGLGLAIAKQLVEMHNGRITVVSNPGEGSTFSISLPVHDTRPGKNDVQQADKK